MSRRLERRRLVEAIDGRLDVGRLTPAERARLLDAAVLEGVRGLVAQRNPGLAASPVASRAAGVVAAHLTRRAVGLLEGAGIECAVLKGVAVAALAWDRPALRPQWDVDLLVGSDDVGRAVDALRRGGLAGETKLDGESWHHVVLRTTSPAGGLLEIHRALTVDLPVAVDVRVLLARRIRISTPDGELPALDHEDAVVYLALHAAVHALDRLEWLVDLAGYAARQPVDWRVASRRAREWEVTLAVQIAWREASRLFDAPIPASAIAALGVPPARRAVARTLLATAMRTEGLTRQTFERLFRLSLVPAGGLVATLRRKLAARSEARRAPSGRS